MNEQIGNKINDKTYIPLTPFKGWVIENFPFIEADFDAITNYQLLCKVIEYLNNVISNQNTVQELGTELVNAYNTLVDDVNNKVNSLESFMNNYFNNLDVQEEINNKLDDMVENGTLTTIISSYLTPYIDEQNQRITLIDNKVNAATSGSPLVASSTSDMTNTNRIYVNTTDGYWYYYNGSAWTRGDVYQSTGISNGTVTYENLEKELKTDYISVNTTTTYKPTTSKVVQTDGTIINGQATYGYYEINVNPYESYKLFIMYNTSNFGTNSVRYMFKYNDTVISYTTGTNMPEVDENNCYSEIVNIPYNVNKLLINAEGFIGGYSANYINKISRYKHINIGKEDLDNKLKSFFNDVYTEQTPTLFIDDCYMNISRTPLSYTSTKLYSLEVTPNTKYRVTLKQIYTNPALFFTNNNASYTKTLNNVEYIIKSTPYKLQSETSSYQFENYEITIPEDCTTLYINKLNNDSSFKIEKVTSYQIDIDDTNVTTNPLNNKTLLFAGDSVMAATTAGVKGWVGIMEENNPTTNFYNYGHDGYTIAKAEDSWSSRSIQNVLPTMLSEHPNPDYIIFQGGINDMYGSEHGITLGTILSGYDTTNVDRTSFTGGMEYIIDYLYTNFPGVKIAYIVSHQIYSNYFVPYMERAIEVCKKWSVPIINLMEEGNLNFKINYMRTNYSINSDGIHPNLDGYEIETPFIENSIKYKI